MTTRQSDFKAAPQDQDQTQTQDVELATILQPTNYLEGYQSEPRESCHEDKIKPVLIPILGSDRNPTLANSRRESSSSSIALETSTSLPSLSPTEHEFRPAGHLTQPVSNNVDTDRNDWSKEVANGDNRQPAPPDERCPALYSVNSGRTSNDNQPLLACWPLGKPGLLYCSREPLTVKNFQTEIRAVMDVEQFCHQAELLLDLNETSMTGIVERMLAKLAEDEGIPSDRLAEIRDALFVPGSSVLLARTIQGYYQTVDSSCADLLHRSRTPANLSQDQSWLCAL